MMLYVVAQLLTVAVVAGASAHLVGDTRKTEALGDLNDKTGNFYNEKAPHDIQISWQTVEEILELTGELGNVTSKFYIIVSQLCPTLSTDLPIKIECNQIK